MKSARITLLALAVAAAAAFIGCNGIDANIGPELDPVAQKLDEFGTVTMSAPIFAKPDDRFAFTITPNADQFYKDAQSNIQGAAAQSTEESFLMSLYLGGQFDPTLLSQFQFQQRQFTQQDSLQSQADAMRLQAAKTQYRADLAEAHKEKDATKRAHLIAEAQKNYADAIAPTTRPAPPVADPDQKLPELPEGKAKAPAEAEKALSSDKFSAPGELIKGKNAVLSDRAALIIAAGDTATKAIFSVLGKPEDDAKFAGKKVLFAVTMVSVNPGSRTRKGYSADIMMRVKYEFVPVRYSVIKDLKAKDWDVSETVFTEIMDNAKRLDGILVVAPGSQPAPGATAPATPSEGSSVKAGKVTVVQASAPRMFQLLNTAKTLGPPAAADRASALYQLARNLDKTVDSLPASPLVSAIAPMNDAQVLDLQNSRRDQTAFGLEIAAALRYAGLQAQADAIAQYVKRRQSDIGTRSENIVANAYALAGGHFGFEVGPSLKAIENPAKYSEPVDILTRQAFPVLLIVGMEESDIRPRIVEIKGPNPGDAPVHLCVERRLVISQTSQWHPLSGNGDRWTERDRIRMAASVANARELAERRRNIVEAQIADLESTEQFTSSDIENLNGNNAAQATAVRNKLEKEGAASATLAGRFAAADLGATRADALMAKLSGGKTSQYLPPEFVTIPHDDFKEPAVAKMFPGAVALNVDADGKPVAKTVALFLIGTHLKAIDADTIAVANGNATVAASAIKPTDSMIPLTLTVTDDSAPIVLKLPVKGQRRSILTLPITVSLNTPDEVPYVQRTVTPQPSANQPGTDKIEFKGVSDDVVKAEIEKNKPVPAPASQPKPKNQE